MSIIYANEPAWTEQNLQVARSKKSTIVAICWSLGASIIPPAAGVLMLSTKTHPDWVNYCGGTLIAAGFFVGPSAGHFYAGQGSRGMRYIKTRLIIGAGGCIGSLLLYAILKPSLMTSYDLGKSIICGIPISLAALSIIIHDLYDIYTVPSSVQRYNSSLQLQIKPELNLIDKRFGIGFVYRF